MAEDKPRLARLTAILTQLQSKRTVTAKAIAEKHNISIRTVYRDIRTLEQSGVPIISEAGKGYSILEGYRLPPIMFTEEEANALIMAEQLILKNKDESLTKYYVEAVTKIKTNLKLNQKTKTDFLSNRIQIRNNYHQEKTSNYLIQLQSTIANFQIVKIQYHSLNDERSERNIEPFALYTTKDNWVLIAFCLKRKDFRAFRLDRIEYLQTTGLHFEPHKITLEEYLEQCRKNWQSNTDIPLSPSPSTFALNQKNENMQHVQIESFKVIGIAIRTSNANGQAATDIAGLWNKFMTQSIAEKIPNKVDNTVYSIYTDYEGDHNKPYTALLACKVKNLDQIPEGMIGKTLDGGKYVKMSTRGDLADGIIVQKWLEIWDMGLHRKYTADFEVFGEKAQNPKDAEVDFLIAVE